MMKYYICPDEKRIEIEKCLKENGCHMNERCMSRSTLHHIQPEHKDKNTLSVTQLLKGTRQLYLEMTVDYATEPSSMIYALLGTGVHSGLAHNIDPKNIMTEYPVSWNGIIGHIDLIEIENNKITIIDRKTSGSFAIAKALGIEAVYVESDEICKRKTTYNTGEDTIVRFKGETKLVKELVPNPEKRDMDDWIMQLNMYKVLLQKHDKKFQNKDIRLQIEAIPRDGGTFVAKNRGIDKNIYLIDVPIIQENEVIDFMESKKRAIVEALETEQLPKICSKEERWNDYKCKSYCSVRNHCSYAETIKEK